MHLTNEQEREKALNNLNPGEYIVDGDNAIRNKDGIIVRCIPWRSKLPKDFKAYPVFTVNESWFLNGAIK